MANNRTTGSLGLSIPVINTSVPPKLKMTPELVIKWRASLPMADTGVSAKKMFMALNDLNNTELSPADRFEIVEQLRVPLKSICTTLKKHYIEQRKPLNERQITIANLRQSLLTEMVDNYKTIFEQLGAKTDASNADKIMLTTVMCRILYYFNSILICRYQLYSYIPNGLWSEVHLMYKYAKKNNLLTQKIKCIFSINHETTSVLTAYSHIILLSATDPYQWRQAEQHSLNKVIGLWDLEPIIYEHTQIPSDKAGTYVIDLDKDLPPIAYGFKTDGISNSCIAFDLSTHVKHIQGVLERMMANEAKIKIQQYGNPEYSATKPTLHKLINIWSTQMTRSSTRFPIDAKIKIAFGLIAAHYYINNQKEFNSHPTNLLKLPDKNKPATTVLASDLPTFEVDEEDDEEENMSILTTVAEKEPSLSSDGTKFYAPEKEDHYQIYDYTIEDISATGLCVTIKGGSFPPFHASEIVVFKNIMNEDQQWSIGAVRWLKRKRDDLFQIGIKLISPYAKAGGIQMIRDEKPIGHLLRCLVLPAMPDLKLSQMLITANPPFHSNKVILFVDNDNGIETTLSNEIEATDMYYQYAYTSKEVIAIAHEDSSENKDKSKESDENDQTNTEFDSIWKDL